MRRDKLQKRAAASKTLAHMDGDLEIIFSRRPHGNEAAEALKRSLGKVITAIELIDNTLLLTFEDESKLQLLDDLQRLKYPYRYMRTDDDLADYVGSQLLQIQIRNAPDRKERSVTLGFRYFHFHEVQFLVVKTSKGQFVMSNHNEHNGYYSGFYIEAEILPQ